MERVSKVVRFSGGFRSNFRRPRGEDGDPPDAPRARRFRATERRGVRRARRVAFGPDGYDDDEGDDRIHPVDRLRPVVDPRRFALPDSPEEIVEIPVRGRVSRPQTHQNDTVLGFFVGSYPPVIYHNFVSLNLINQGVGDGQRVGNSVEGVWLRARLYFYISAFVCINQAAMNVATRMVRVLVVVDKQSRDVAPTDSLSQILDYGVLPGTAYSAFRDTDNSDRFDVLHDEVVCFSDPTSFYAPDYLRVPVVNTTGSITVQLVPPPPPDEATTQVFPTHDIQQIGYPFVNARIASMSFDFPLNNRAFKYNGGSSHPLGGLLQMYVISDHARYDGWDPAVHVTGSVRLSYRENC